MKIPKLFHQVWVGGNPFPKKFKKYRKSWINNHPDWEFYLWTEKNLPDDLLNLDCLELCNTYSEQSDVLRYSLLYKFGGCYLDVDFRNFKNIEPLINDFELFISTEDYRHLCGGFIGSIPQHPVIKRLIDRIPEQLKNTVGNTSDLRIGPSFVTENIHPKEIAVLDKIYFYPYLPGQQYERDNIEKKGIAYASHEWAASWINNPIRR
jgi:mannosyltransferase OCH1-like enzyme